MAIGNPRATGATHACCAARAGKTMPAGRGIPRATGACGRAPAAACRRRISAHSSVATVSAIHATAVASVSAVVVSAAVSRAVEVAAAITTAAVKCATAVASTTVKAAAAIATTAAVKTTTTTASTTVAAMLSKRRDRPGNEEERSDPCEKCFQRGGSVHNSYLYQMAAHPAGRPLGLWYASRVPGSTLELPNCEASSPGTAFT